MGKIYLLATPFQAQSLRSPFPANMIVAATRQFSKPSRFLSQFLSFSSRPRPSPKGLPEYKIYGEQAVLKFAPIFPTFKYGRNGDSLFVAKVGRLMVEFTPRSSEGFFINEQRLFFAMSPEEVGLAVSQLPGSPVKLQRSFNTTLPLKVLNIQPSDGESVMFNLQLCDHISGSVLAPGTDGNEVTEASMRLQAGEFAVLRSVMENLIPTLIGWNVLSEMGNLKIEDMERDQMQTGHSPYQGQGRDQPSNRPSVIKGVADTSKLNGELPF